MKPDPIEENVVEAFDTNPGKMFVPVHLLVSARSVVEAMMMFVDPLKETPLMVRAFWSVVAVPALPPMVRVEVETE